MEQELWNALEMEACGHIYCDATGKSSIFRGCKISFLYTPKFPLRCMASLPSEQVRKKQVFSLFQFLSVRPPEPFCLEVAFKVERYYQ